MWWCARCTGVSPLISGCSGIDCVPVAGEHTSSRAPTCLGHGTTCGTTMFTSMSISLIQYGIYIAAHSVAPRLFQCGANVAEYTSHLYMPPIHPAILVHSFCHYISMHYGAFIISFTRMYCKLRTSTYALQLAAHLKPWSHGARIHAFMS